MLQIWMRRHVHTWEEMRCVRKGGRGFTKTTEFEPRLMCVEKYSGNKEGSRKFTDVSTRETFDSIYKPASQLPTLVPLGNLM